ncbi:MAG: class I mannose-6-phosphate isomerase [Bacteroidales bacterium]|nr:class I mannose-6-phosphate isomerase [Bacteroidales bacterium]
MKEMRQVSGQFPLPLKKPPGGEGYDIYPSFNVGEGKIFAGFASLLDSIVKHRTVIIDGYTGIRWDLLKQQILNTLRDAGVTARCFNTREFLKQEQEIEEMTSPFSGGSDPLFATRCDLPLGSFFRMAELTALRTDPDYDVNIIIGTGASLSGWQGLMIYADLPKNEQQYRARTGSITNLGLSRAGDAGTMYKRSYFIDWPVLNRHKRQILPFADIVVDAQRPDEPVWMEGKVLREALSEMSRNLFRVRPWFEPGPWGGTWIKDNISGLNREVPNYAWSFELISPENGLLLESSSLLLEVSFDSLMYIGAKEVLGDCHERFGNEFPIRFDFLDTYNGGPLSVQCHPRPEYARDHFGENFTQEEAYYIVDTKDDAFVYLGFRNDIDPGGFVAALKESAENNEPLDVDSYVHKQKADKHDLFLIPSGTIHGSGKNNMVLEISSTPYIFTFKMYDWLRLDLNGRPRNLNIDRAGENLFFDRKGEYVSEHLKSKPVLLSEGEGWSQWHLPTHETHLYDVMRYSIMSSVDISTENKCLVMNLVGGHSVNVETRGGMQKKISYAETFVVTAAAGSVRITNIANDEAIIVAAFVK